VKTTILGRSGWMVFQSAHYYSVVKRYGEDPSKWPWIERVREDGVLVAKPRAHVDYKTERKAA